MIHRAVRAVDTITAPEARGRGVFTRFTLAILSNEITRDDDVSFVFNTPNDQSRPGYLKMGRKRRCAGAGVDSAQRGRSHGAQESSRVLINRTRLRPRRHRSSPSASSVRRPGPSDLDGLHADESEVPHRSNGGVPHPMALPRSRNRSLAEAVSRVGRGGGGLPSPGLGTNDRIVLPRSLGQPGQERHPVGRTASARGDARISGGLRGGVCGQGNRERAALVRAGFLPMGLPGPRFTVNTTGAATCASWPT